MANTKRFHVSSVLSISTSKLVASGGVEELYAILNWMTGDNLFTHQLPRALRECRPWLMRRHECLAQIGDGPPCEFPKGTKAESPIVAAWVAELQDRFHLPEWFDVEPIPQDDHDRIDPIKEAEDLFGKDKVVVVEI